MSQDWFEMKDIRRRKLDGAVWIPLRAVNTIEKNGKFGYVGFKEEFFGAGALAIPINKREAAEKLGWMDVGIGHDHGGCFQDGKYIPSDIYEDYDREFVGLHLVLAQRTNRNEVREWHLHQDLVITLGLKREGDVWVCPDEGYTEVARFLRSAEGSRISFRTFERLFVCPRYGPLCHFV